MKILKKNSTYIIEIEQSEKETGRTMYNTRHELAKLITQKEILEKENQQLKKQKDDVVEYIKNNKLFNYVYDEEELFEIITDKQAKNDLLRMLGEIDE